VENKLNELIVIGTSKWTCSTCLVSNESDKATCVCCSSPKKSAFGGAKPDRAVKSDDQKTKFSELVEVAGSFSNLNKEKTPASNINFGLKPSNTTDIQSSQPIKFGSNFALSTLSVNANPNEVTVPVSNFDSNKKPDQKPFVFMPFGQNTSLNETAKPLVVTPEKMIVKNDSEKKLIEPVCLAPFESTNKPGNNFLFSTNNNMSKPSDLLSASSNLFTGAKPEAEKEKQNKPASSFLPFGFNTPKTVETAFQANSLNSVTNNLPSVSNTFSMTHQTGLSTNFADIPKPAVPASSFFSVPSVISGISSNTRGVNPLTINKNLKSDTTTESIGFFGTTSPDSKTSSNSSISIPTVDKKPTVTTNFSSLNFSLTNNSNADTAAATANLTNKPTLNFSFGSNSNQKNLFAANGPTSKPSSSMSTDSSTNTPNTIAPFGTKCSPPQTDTTNTKPATTSFFSNTSNTVTSPFAGFNSFGTSSSTLPTTAAATTSIFNNNNNNSTDNKTTGNFFSNNVTNLSVKSLFFSSNKTEKTMFGSTAIQSLPNSITSNNTGFNMLNQSGFNFGQKSEPASRVTPQSTQQPFMFGAGTNNPANEQKPAGFTFNSGQLLAQNGEMFATPLKTAAATSSSPSNSSPSGQFVFTGFSSGDQTSTPDFEKLFTPDTTPSSQRQYKKPTRRFKK